jgi:pantetheine-phosphate adenylyltransferase
MGGTFDQLHNGHRKLLTLAAASSTDLLIIGITGDEMLKNKKNKDQISSFRNREEGVDFFLKIAKPNLKLSLVELSDPYGPTITDPSIDALVVSSETMGG